VFKVTPIMGPGAGNKELEKCPPSFHVELTEAELVQALRDPAGTAKKLGMESPIESVHITPTKDVAFVGEDTDAGTTSPTIYCCVKCLSSSLCCQAWPQ